MTRPARILDRSPGESFSRLLPGGLRDRERAHRATIRGLHVGAAAGTLVEYDGVFTCALGANCYTKRAYKISSLDDIGAPANGQ